MPGSIRSKEELLSFAKSAASSFVHNKIPLQESITKTAQQEGLIPDQIRFVAQEANKHAWASLYKENQENAYSFALADSEKVISSLQDNYAPTVIKDIDMDYVGTPVQKTADWDDFKAWGVEKVASATCRSKKEIQRDLSKKLEKLSYLKGELRMRELENLTKAENEVTKIAQLLKNELVETSFSKRPEEFKKFAEACIRISPTKEMVRNINQIRENLEKVGMMQKTAGLEAPEELINRSTGARIINGNSEIIMRIKTLMEWNGAANEAHSRLSLVDETLPKVKEAIREL